MSSTTDTIGYDGVILKKKRSLKQILIPTRRKSSKSLRNKSLSSSIPGEDESLPTIGPQDHVMPVPSSTQHTEPHSATSSRAPSSAFSMESSRRPSISRGLLKQADNDILVRTERLIETLQNVERKPGRARASTLTNFSKPYGSLQENTLIPASRPARKTSHQTLRNNSFDPSPRNPRNPVRAFTDGPSSVIHGQRNFDPRSASIPSALHQEGLRPPSQSARQAQTNHSPDLIYRAWVPGQDETRDSTHSVHSFGSSLQGSKHSSTFTKISSSTETTLDGEFMDESKQTISVNEVIDLYAELDETDDQTWPSAAEINQRSREIAEAMTAPIGSLPTPGRQGRSLSTPLISPQRVRNMLHEPPALQKPTRTHDHYGFKTFSRDVTLNSYSDWYKEYSKFQVRRNAKWYGLLSDHGIFTSKPTRFPTPSAKVQRYIRKGIPPAWRGDAWFFYAGAGELQAAQPDHYVNLVVQSQSDALNRNDKEAVERDLHRTFPDNLHFKSETTSSTSSQIIETPIMTALRRLLCAFAIDHPKIGYCQSLNFIAGLLLLFLPEEKAYWMLHIMTTRLLPGTHDLSLEGANVDLWVLMLALKQANPGVWSKVGGDIGSNSSRLPPISLCTTSWFMSVFIGTLPIESVLRVWDVLFYEGSKTLFRIALAIFKSGEMQIKSLLDPMETFQLVQSLPRKMVDVGSLFDIAFSRGEVGRRWIEKKRAERREFYAKERAVEKARRESRDGGARRASEDDLRSPATIDMASPDSPFVDEPRKDYWGRPSTAVVQVEI